MAADDVDLRDMVLEAAAEAQALMMEIEREMMMPQVMNGIGKMWTQLPDEMKERFKLEKPREYAALMEAMKSG